MKSSIVQCAALIILAIIQTHVAFQFAVLISGAGLLGILCVGFREFRENLLRNMLREGWTPAGHFYRPRTVMALYMGCTTFLYLRGFVLPAVFELAALPAVLWFRRAFCDRHALALSMAHHARHSTGE